jgi:hypothetical protein
MRVVNLVLDREVGEGDVVSLDLPGKDLDLHILDLNPPNLPDLPLVIHRPLENLAPLLNSLHHHVNLVVYLLVNHLAYLLILPLTEIQKAHLIVT